MNASNNNASSQNKRHTAGRNDLKPGALLGPLAWGATLPRGKSIFNRRGPDPLLDARNYQGHHVVPLFFVRSLVLYSFGGAIAKIATRVEPGDAANQVRPNTTLSR